MQYWGQEIKTSSSDIGPGSTYMAKLAMDAQVSNYFVGMRALGYEPHAMLYDVLRKPTQEPRMATPEADRKYTKATKTEPSRLYANQRTTDETPDEYRTRLLDDIAERPEHYYQRATVVRLEQEERDAAADVWQTAEQIRHSRTTGRFPRNPDACDAFHRLCAYWPICSGETDAQDLRYETLADPHRELAPDARRRLPILTTSAMRSYRSCPRKYQLAYERGLRPRADAHALRFGTRIHAALEAWAPTRDLDAALAALGAGDDAYDDARAQAMVVGYAARWGDEIGFSTVATEVQFLADLRNPETGAASRTFQLSGKLDGILLREGA